MTQRKVAWTLFEFLTVEVKTINTIDHRKLDNTSTPNWSDIYSIKSTRGNIGIIEGIKSFWVPNLNVLSAIGSSNFLAVYLWLTYMFVAKSSRWLNNFIFGIWRLEGGMDWFLKEGYHICSKFHIFIEAKLAICKVKKVDQNAIT